MQINAHTSSGLLFDEESFMIFYDFSVFTFFDVMKIFNDQIRIRRRFCIEIACFKSKIHLS